MAYAYVKDGANASNGNTITFSPTNSGDLLVVCISTSAGGGSPTVTFTDNLSDTWSTAQATVNDGNGAYHSIFYLLNCPAGITTLTATFNGGTPGTCNMVVAEYSGLASYIGVATKNTQASPGTGTNAITSNNVNVSTQPALLLGYTYDINQNNVSAAGTSPLAFTLRYGASQNTGQAFEDARVTATGNALANFTTIHGTDTFTTFAVAFAEYVAPSIAVVQSVNGQTVSNATDIVVTINGVTAGNTIVCIASYFNTSAGGGHPVPTCVDTTYSTALTALETPPGVLVGTVSNLGAGIWYLPGGTVVAGSHTVKVSFASAGFNFTTGSVTLVEISGLASASPADPTQPASAVWSSGSVLTASSGQSLAAPPAIALAAIAQHTTVGVTNAGFACTGFTDVNNISNTATANFGAEQCYEIYAGSATPSAAFGWTDANTNGAQAVIGVLSQTAGIVTLPLLGTILM
jgi:hypothetical protein